MNSNLSYVYSAYLEGLNCKIIKVEVNIKMSLPRFTIVGLVTTTIREATERVRIAIENSGHFFPSTKNILVNLSPAGIKKDGTYLDLSIAVGVLLAEGLVSNKIDLNKTVVIGELGLDGSIKPMKGLINILIAIKKFGFESIILPKENQDEASFVSGIKVYPVEHLNEIIPVLDNKIEPVLFSGNTIFNPPKHFEPISLFNDQVLTLRALVIAVAGRHHLLMMGSPGIGKTMLAKYCSLLEPPITEEEFLDLIRIKSLSEHIHLSNLQSIQRPFRNPHHTSSDISIVGGGNDIRMGEVTLAHNGILFLDELGEFKPAVIQSLREPLEERKITISRARGHVTYPASFLLISASNPCPCGYYGSLEKDCTCSYERIRKYHTRFSGPFMDRIDIRLDVQQGLSQDRNLVEVDLNEIYRSIQKAKFVQDHRYQNTNYYFNGYIDGTEIEKYCVFSDETRLIWEKIKKEFFGSIRRLNKIRKISRTIADLDNSELIQQKHLFEAYTLNMDKIGLKKNAA